MAWVTKTVLASIADVSAATLVSGPTQTRSAVDARVAATAENIIGDIITNDPAVTQAVIDTIENDPALLGQLSWGKSVATVNDELASMPLGSHPIPDTNVSAALGLPTLRFGNLEIVQNGNNGRVYIFRTNHVSAATPFEEWKLSTHGDGSIRMDWTQTWPIDLETIDSTSDQWRVRDQQDRVALAVDSRGRTRVGATTHAENEPGFRVVDRDGRMAFEVDAEGKTHVYDPADGSSGGVIDTVHVFGGFGQSNMSGRGRPVEGPQSPRIMQFGANNRIIEQAPVQLDMHDAPSGTSPALFFARNYLATQPSNVAVLLVPGARGGTTFTASPAPADMYTWTKGAAASPEYGLYDLAVQQMLDAVTAAKAAGYAVHVKGILWHQGEGNGSMSENDYAAHLDQLIADFRTDLDEPRLPVMIGQMAPEGIALSGGRQGIDRAHQDTPQRVPYTGFAKATAEGHNPGDTTHFSTVGTSFLGDTYAAAYFQALGNVHV